jgi:hypothetical protein
VEPTALAFRTCLERRFDYFSRMGKIETINNRTGTKLDRFASWQDVGECMREHHERLGKCRYKRGSKYIRNERRVEAIFPTLQPLLFLLLLLPSF